jgi:hypothetical protein
MSQNQTRSNAPVAQQQSRSLGINGEEDLQLESPENFTNLPREDIVLAGVDNEPDQQGAPDDRRIFLHLQRMKAQWHASHRADLMALLKNAKQNRVLLSEAMEVLALHGDFRDFVLLKPYLNSDEDILWRSAVTAIAEITTRHLSDPNHEDGIDILKASYEDRLRSADVSFDGDRVVFFESMAKIESSISVSFLVSTLAQVQDPVLKYVILQGLGQQGQSTSDPANKHEITTTLRALHNEANDQLTNEAHLLSEENKVYWQDVANSAREHLKNIEGMR